MNWEEYFNKNYHTELSEIMEKPCKDKKGWFCHNNRNKICRGMIE